MRLQLPEPRITRVIRWTLLTALLLHLPVWVASSYAAWFQVYRLELDPPPGALTPGMPLRAPVVTSGRVFVDMRMELVQDGTSRLLGTHQVDDNDWAGYDHRPRRDTFELRLSPRDLAELHPGPAVLRVIANGRPQWTRTPPPAIRERPVMIASAAGLGSR